MSTSTQWWWVRHAPIIAGTTKIWGQSDVSCDTSDTGSFAALARILPGNAVWVVSPLRRTRETLLALAATGIEVPEPLVEPDFAEQSFGQWQGLSWNEMEVRDPESYAAFWRDPTRSAAPGGESLADLMQRVRRTIERLTAENPGRTIVCVSHGGTIRAAVATALALSPEAAMAVVVDTLSVTRISHLEDGLLRSRGGVWRVEGVNMPCRWIS